MSLQRTGFQNWINTYLPPAVVGMFSSMNPRATVLAGTGALKAAAAPNQPIVGHFAMVLGDTATADCSGTGLVGFVANELQTVITDFLGQSRLSVQAGFPITLFSHGDFWAVVTGATQASLGAAVFALEADGTPTVDDASGANPATGFIVGSLPGKTATATGNSTISASGVLTVPGVVTGTLEAGQNVSSSGGATVVPNVFILNQLTGTAGAGAGATYQTTYAGPAIGNFTLGASSGQLVKISRTY